MSKSKHETAYLIFDVETVGDGELISRVKYPDQGLSAAEALKRYRAELMEQKGSDVLPVTFVLPIAVAVAKVSADFRLLDVTALDHPDYRPAQIAGRFWQGWEHYRRPTLVTFNGCGYDLPVLELAAFRYGLNLNRWFQFHGRSFEQPRHRYNQSSHIDLMELLSNYNAVALTGGLNVFANLLGKPGKNKYHGSQVQDLHDEGCDVEINDYCRCDVLDTYFVFLRTMVMLGELSLDDEQSTVAEAKFWLEERRESNAAYAHYLQHWGDWIPPQD